MRGRFWQKAIFLMNPREDADNATNPSAISGLQVQPGVAHVEHFPHVVYPGCLHRPKDHVRRGPSTPHVIAADICGEGVLPPSGLEDAVGYRPIEPRCGSTEDVPCFEPC